MLLILRKLQFILHFQL